MRHAEQIIMTPNHLKCNVWIYHKDIFRFDTVVGRIVEAVGCLFKTVPAVILSGQHNLRSPVSLSQM